jgi:hypothetical protein
MNKRLILLALLALTWATGSAQRLSIAKTTIDVGKTGYQMPVTATFELKNKGLKHLQISQVKTDCGCTRVDYPEKSIGAGDKFTISLTYDARMLGHFVKQAAVYSNGSKEPVYLQMKGVVVTELKDYSKAYPFDFEHLLSDINNVEFDDVNMGEHPEVEIHLLNNGESTLMPNLLHLPPYLSAFASPEKLSPGQAGRITLTLNSDKVHDFGLTQTSVYLAHNLGDKVSSDSEIPVSVVLLPKMQTASADAPKMQLSTDSLTLGMIGGKLVKNGTIAITNTGRSTLDISSLQMFTGGMKVMLDKRQLKPFESAKLKVTIEREKILKARSMPRVLMITNDPDRSKVVIKVQVN